MAKIKVQISIDEELLVAVDDYCDKNFMNRSWLFSQSVTQTINQQKVIDAMVSLSLAISKMAETCEPNDEVLKEIESFQSLCKFVVGKK